METVHVQTTVKLTVEKVWQAWTSPEHIVKWNNASDGWHTPHATNDLKVGGKFLSRMESKDGSMGFDFEGIYDAVVINKLINYKITDGRNVKIEFKSIGNETNITESFDSEDVNPVEFQRQGWQSILDNFKKYAENMNWK